MRNECRHICRCAKKFWKSKFFYDVLPPPIRAAHQHQTCNRPNAFAYFTSHISSHLYDVLRRKPEKKKMTEFVLERLFWKSPWLHNEVENNETVESFSVHIERTLYRERRSSHEWAKSMLKICWGKRVLRVFWRKTNRRRISIKADGTTIYSRESTRQKRFIGIISQVSPRPNHKLS